MAQDAVGLLDALGIQQAHIVGISMGGAIAQLVAIDYPERTLSLTLIAADSGNPDLPAVARPEAFEGVPAQPPAGDREAFIDWQVKTWQALAGSNYTTDEVTLRKRAERDFERGYDPDGLTRQQTVSLIGHLDSARYRLSNLEKISKNITKTYELTITRVFDAPVERVWSAWVEPEMVKKWWGPKGFMVPVVEMDFREGGTSLVSML